jgi:hypothetical protein
MCFFSLHNEGPPINFDPSEAVKVSQGLVIGELATSAMLRAMADCFQAMAYMVDTGGASVSTWGEVIGGTANPAALQAKAAEIQTSYTNIFDSLQQTVDRITFSVQKYRELQEYAQSALAEGRGVDFEQALVRLGVGGFDAMVQRRIELLRKLKTRVQLLQQLQAAGTQILATNNYADFFQWYMQPMRDLSIATHELYDEGIRGARASHQAMNQTSRMVGEELSVDILAGTEQTLNAATVGNGRSHNLQAEGVH